MEYKNKTLELLIGCIGITIGAMLGLWILIEIVKMSLYE